MYEHGAQFTLVGSDGTTIQFNDGASGFLLEDVTGFDSPNIRLNIEDLPETDGAAAGDSWLGQRPVTLKGRIAGLSAGDRNAAVANLQRALRGLRADLTLKSQPTGMPAMQTTGRVQSVRVTGGYVKDFLIALVCPDPRIYSQTLHQWAATQASTPAAPGAAFDWNFSVSWGGSGGGYSVALAVSNAGNFDTPAVFRIDGPITSPQLTNGDTNKSLYIDSIALAAGEWVEVDTGARTVTKNDGTNWYAYVRYPDSVWLQLPPGSSTFQLWGTATSAATGLTVSARDAWT